MTPEQSVTNSVSKRMHEAAVGYLIANYPTLDAKHVVAFYQAGLKRLLLVNIGTLNLQERN